MHQLASIYANTGKIEEAIAHYQQSLEINESIGDVQGQAATLHQLASIYANTGKIEEAIALYQQVLEINESIGNVLVSHSSKNRYITSKKPNKYDRENHLLSNADVI